MGLASFPHGLGTRLGGISLVPTWPGNEARWDLQGLLGLFFLLVASASITYLGTVLEGCNGWTVKRAVQLQSFPQGRNNLQVYT